MPCRATRHPLGASRNRRGLLGSHPGARFAERGGDFALAHLLGDLAAQRNRVRAALQRSEIEPFMGGDEIDDAGTAARPVKPALEQHVLDRGLRERHGAIQIQCPMKHVWSPLYCRWPRSPPSAAPVPAVKRLVIPPRAISKNGNRFCVRSRATLEGRII